MSDQTEHEAEELGDLIAEWTRCESATFVGNPEPQVHGWRYIQGVRLLPCHVRRRAIQILHQLLVFNGAVVDQLGMVLTLLDALAVRALQENQTAEELTDMTTLVSIVRVVIKSGESEVREDWNSCLAFSNGVPAKADQCVGVSEDMVQAVVERELWIFGVMHGRISLPSLPSPGHWVKMIMRSLWARASHAEEDLRSSATRNIHYCTELLVQRVGSAAGLPPRAVALGACTMGLIMAGIFPVDEARPRDVDRSVWDTSLLRQQGPAVQSDTVVNIEQLSTAARCSPEDVRTLAYKAVSALQDVLANDF